MAKLADIKAGFGKRILKLRISKNLKQVEFGEKVGVSQRYIAMLEKGERQPSQALIIAIAVKHRFSETYLRTGRNKKAK